MADVSKHRGDFRKQNIRLQHDQSKATPVCAGNAISPFENKTGKGLSVDDSTLE